MGFDLTAVDSVWVHGIWDSIRFAKFCDSIWRWKIWGWNRITANAEVLCVLGGHFTSSAAQHSSADCNLGKVVVFLSQPVTGDVTKTFWMNEVQSNDFLTVHLDDWLSSFSAFPQLLQAYCLFSVAGATIHARCNRLLASTLKSIFASYASDWIDSSLLTVQTLTDCNFCAFFMNKSSEQSYY